nr:MAG TPA: hypothetical protein [Caudoviricetes sp.]
MTRLEDKFYRQHERPSINKMRRTTDSYLNQRLFC